MVANYPADLTFSFTGLALRGGQTGPHADGWGLSLYDGKFARTFREKDPAHSSRLARFLKENPIRTRLAIAHVRKMTRGVASLANTHPFVRVLNQRHMVFAHNGTLPRIKERHLRIESTLGDTDSEHAFCVILERLRQAYGSRHPEDPRELGNTLWEVGNELGSEGVFNFLFADGEHLFARCGDHLSFIEWRAPAQHTMLVDAEVQVRLDDAMGPEKDALMAIVATTPLTRDATWVDAAPGTLWAFSGGRLVQAWEPPPNYHFVPSAAPAWEPG